MAPFGPEMFHSASIETRWEWAKSRRQVFTSPLRDSVLGILAAIITGLVSYFGGEASGLRATAIASIAGVLVGVIPPHAEALLWYIRRNRVLLEEEVERLRSGQGVSEESLQTRARLEERRGLRSQIADLSQRGRILQTNVL